MRQAFLLLTILLTPLPSLAGGPCSGVKGGCGRGSTYRSSAPASGAVHVSGYTRKDGTYVAPHNRSRADGDLSNNWSAAGNTNPFTGKAGTKGDPSSSSSSSSLSLSSHRTKPRTKARTTAWGGTGSAPDDDDPVRLAPAPVERKENEMRTWHSGTRSVEARFVSMSSGKVKLHTSDGRDITLALEKLSSADQAWIEHRR